MRKGKRFPKLDMKFVVLYENTDERRNHVLNLLKQVIGQNTDLSRATIDHPICSVRPVWPEDESLLSLPLNIQCEEMEYKEGEFVSFRKLVVDAEFVVEEKKEEVKT